MSLNRALLHVQLVILGIALVVFPYKAKAEPLRYLGLPVFYSNYIPKLAHCVVDTEHNYNHCGWKAYPDTGMVGVTTAVDKPYRDGYAIELMDAVVCIDGLCKTNYDELRGQFEDKGIRYWYIPKGFYLTRLNGDYTAIKYGNGPQQTLFPIRNVQLLPGETPDGYYVPEDQERYIYNVSCNVANECVYLGRTMTFDELVKYIPKRLSYECDPRFCHDPVGNVIGLNPKGLVREYEITHT